jgi:ATPase subunit of ABC transporter with duplicated ATPase domains
MDLLQRTSCLILLGFGFEILDCSFSCLAEARSHGVGYYAFSQDEAERRAQQEALSKLRQETQREQVAAQGLRERRQQQLQARLKAARQRKRARMGLPPLEDGKIFSIKYSEP